MFKTATIHNIICKNVPRIKRVVWRKRVEGAENFFSTPFLHQNRDLKPGVIPGVIPRIKRRVESQVRHEKLLGILFWKNSVEYLKQLSDYPGFKIRIYSDQEK